MKAEQADEGVESGGGGAVQPGVGSGGVGQNLWQVIIILYISASTVVLSM